MSLPADISPSPPIEIESLDLEGQGVAHPLGKTLFIAGALPFETVRYRSYRKKPRFEQADVTEVLIRSSSRVAARCPHFGRCGGCSIQHLEPGAQVASKQRVLEDVLQRIARIMPGSYQVLAAIHGPTWGYRHRARLTVRYVAKKNDVLVGFHERRSHYIADLRQCEILPPPISRLLLPLRALVMGLSIRERLPQIEIALGDEIPPSGASDPFFQGAQDIIPPASGREGQGGGDGPFPSDPWPSPPTALVLRVLEAPHTADLARLRAFAVQHAVQIWLQPAGPASAQRLHPPPPSDGEALLGYTLPEYALRLAFHPTEFTQVNPAINRVLVARALHLLEPQADALLGERVFDFFCGMGNFSLPIARRGARVLGVEGSAGLVARARQNARAHGLVDRADFTVANLFEVDAAQLSAWGRADRWLIDPPRDGALALCQAITPASAPRRIVYVSCNPATLARDAGVLVHTQGYRLRAAGVINMFPHTAHVESIACFERLPEFPDPPDTRDDASTRR